MLRHVTPSVATELLNRYGLSAGVRHGQHFLVDPNTVRRIVRLAEIGPDEAILEVGAGLGSLTVALSEAARRVVAVEIDGRVAKALREVIAEASNVELIDGDAMHVDLPSILGERARLVANLPYNVATPVMLRVLGEVGAVTGGLVMVQRELGERWTAEPSTRAYGSVTVRIAYHARARIVGDVPPTVFLPPPKVSSVLVAFSRREAPVVEVADKDAFFAFVVAAFAHRRKTLRNSLVAAAFDKRRVSSSLVESGIAERARPEDLSLDDFARLYAAIGR